MEFKFPEYLNYSSFTYRFAVNYLTKSLLFPNLPGFYSGYPCASLQRRRKSKNMFCLFFLECLYVF